MLKARTNHGPAFAAALAMTYLRLRKFHKTQPGVANPQPDAEPTIEIEPAEDNPAPGEIRTRVAAVTIKHRRLPVDREEPEGQSHSGARRMGTLHRPVHAG